VADSEPTGCLNEVRIQGRVSGEPRHRRLPSGDEVVSIRVVVPRQHSARRTPASSRTVSVDTIECVAWSRRPQAVMSGLAPDDQVLVTGALRRRFWRAGGTVASLMEVEVARVRRVRVPRSTSARGRRDRQASDA